MGCCEGKTRPNTDGHTPPERPPSSILQRERLKQQAKLGGALNQSGSLSIPQDDDVSHLKAQQTPREVERRGLTSAEHATDSPSARQSGLHVPCGSSAPTTPLALHQQQPAASFTHETMGTTPRGAACTEGDGVPCSACSSSTTSSTASFSAPPSPATTAPAPHPRLTEAAIMQILSVAGPSLSAPGGYVQPAHPTNDDPLAGTGASLDRTGKTFASDDTYIMLTEPPAKPVLPSPRKSGRTPNPSAPWKKLRRLGRGQYGDVHEAVDKAGTVFAVKLIDASGFKDVGFVKRELDSLRRLVHPNVVCSYGCAHNAATKTLEVLMECCPYGSLADKIAKSEGRMLSRSHVRIYSKQILSGLVYLHGNGVVHRDVKAANVLLGSAGVVKLADFGWLDPALAQARGVNHIGSPAWMSPEEIHNPNAAAHPKSDVWSFGCTVIEMLGHNPWGSAAVMHPFTLIYRIADTDGPPEGMPANLPVGLNDMLLRCFERRLEDRPDAADLLNDEFFFDGGRAAGPPLGSRWKSAESRGIGGLDGTRMLATTHRPNDEAISLSSPSSASSHEAMSSPLSPY
eukprot:TRINITY_DN65817_c0_g1_i1.p1 TRINITY_DN65817_c0_g1~~TRINITY_DN65817_c0_g1_i1.p1  ORF type:complete len:571 (+),score=130.33 TRINITY_DN65817_c0_g1_i1:501-2213(+)